MLGGAQASGTRPGIEQHQVEGDHEHRDHDGHHGEQAGAAAISCQQTAQDHGRVQSSTQAMEIVGQL